MYKVKVDEKLLCFTGSVNGMEYVTDPDVKLVVNGVDCFFTEKSRDTVRTCMAYARMTARGLWHG